MAIPNKVATNKTNSKYGKHQNNVTPTKATANKVNTKQSSTK